MSPARVRTGPGPYVTGRTPRPPRHFLLLVDLRSAAKRDNLGLPRETVQRAGFDVTRA